MFSDVCVCVCECMPDMCTWMCVCVRALIVRDGSEHWLVVLLNVKITNLDN